MLKVSLEYLSMQFYSFKKVNRPNKKLTNKDHETCIKHDTFLKFLD